MDALKTAIAAALASLAQVEQFVRDDGASYYGEAKANLIAAEQAADSVQPAAPVEVDHTADVLAAIAALSTKVDALKPAGA
jgi:hypothetical protein